LDVDAFVNFRQTLQESINPYFLHRMTCSNFHDFMFEYPPQFSDIKCCDYCSDVLKESISKYKVYSSFCNIYKFQKRPMEQWVKYCKYMSFH
jgi:hypothetical protein